MNDLTSVTFVGVGHSVMALIFSGSIVILSMETMSQIMDLGFKEITLAHICIELMFP